MIKYLKVIKVSLSVIRLDFILLINHSSELIYLIYFVYYKEDKEDKKGRGGVAHLEFQFDSIQFKLK